MYVELIIEQRRFKCYNLRFSFIRCNKAYSNTLIFTCFCQEELPKLTKHKNYLYPMFRKVQRSSEKVQRRTFAINTINKNKLIFLNFQKINFIFIFPIHCSLNFSELWI